jgi:formate dehydrogenase subunit gamma
MTDKTTRIGEIIADHASKEGPLLPILHDVQAAFGCVDAAKPRQ